jgi:hypothetical protein
MPPITLNRAQFAQTAAGQKPGANYGNYLSFITARRAANKAPAAPAAPAGPDPLAPWSPAQIAAITGRVQSQFGTPLTAAQIQTEAQGQISPIIAAITKTANDRAAAAGTAIKGYTDSLASMLGSENFAAPYQTAEKGQAAVDAALQQSLAGQGAGLASDLSSRLGVINDPTTAAAASGLASRGAALGTTQLAAGSSALSELIANAASAGEYGLKQPVIARNAGIQGLAKAQGQAQSEIATGTQSALSQLPQIVQALESSNAALRSNRASAAASLFGTLTGQNITKATIGAGIQNANTRATATENAAAIRARTSAAKTAAASTKPSSSATKEMNDGFLYDSNYNRVTRGGNPVKVPIKPGSGGAKAPSASTLKSAANDAYDLYHGKQHQTSTGPVTDAYTQTYQDAIKIMHNKYPGLTRARLVKLLNTWYQPGDYGRPGSQGNTPATIAAANAGLGIPASPFAPNAPIFGP